MSDIAVPSPENKGKKLKGRHVLYWMLGFFGIIFAVNGVFLYQALSSFPGEDVKKSYAQGLDYNQTLAARAAQDVLGWRAELGISDTSVILHLEDKTGTGLSGHPVIGQLRRRATRQGDQTLVFTTQAGGNYQARIDQIEAGQWELRIQVLDLDTEEAIFTARKTLIIE